MPRGYASVTLRGFWQRLKKLFFCDAPTERVQNGLALTQADEESIRGVDAFSFAVRQGAPLSF
jgi:hypothetical protein